jgi:hypothetical protein
LIVAAKYILAVLAVGFLIAATLRTMQRGWQPQSRTWFLIAVIFSSVSAWLWLRT